MSQTPYLKPQASEAGQTVHQETASTLGRRLKAYKAWRDQLSEAIRAYQTWVEDQGLTDGQEDLRVYELIEEIQSDKLTLGLAAEFSRGKTELLNAIFFADFKQRLLPSGAGRTTMCPTELRYDEKLEACVRLLPIETRKTAITIAEYKKTPVYWSTIHIHKPDSAEDVRIAFLEVTRIKKVHIRDAEELGLYDPNRTRRSTDPVPVNDMVDIPIWRHAIINFPHPLLKQGLVILDTPGLNAVGVEPELTMNMLPAAQAVMFVLGADTGVSRSDLDVWTNYVQGAKRSGNMVILNKIDMLWDDLHDDETVQNNIKRQVADVAQTLSVDRRLVFPVSAQKGLLGKIKGDTALIAKSGLESIESHLAQEMIPMRHEIIRDRVVREISGRVQASYDLLRAKVSANRIQHEALKKIGDKNLDAIQRLVADVRAEKQRYDKELEGFQLTRALLTEQANALLGFISLKSVDSLIESSRHEMQDSWTTYGLKAGMETCFKGAAERMENVTRYAEEIQKAVKRIYERLHSEYGLDRINPPPLSVAAHFVEFRRLQEKAEAFIASPAMVATEQHFVIKKFFITLVSQARLIFTGCNDTAKGWFKIAVSPVFQQIQQHKLAIERKLQLLKEIHTDMDSLGEKLAKLDEEWRDLEAQCRTAQQLLVRVQQPLVE